MDSAISTVQTLALQALQKLPPPVQSVLVSSTTRNVATVIFAYALLKQFNSIMSGFVLNNWSSDRYDWSREIVLLTGGCSGIGKSVAEDLAGRGIKVVVADIVEPTYSLPTNVYFYKCDVTSTASVKALGDQIRQDHGDPTVLINNAGVGAEGTILTKAESFIRKVFEVNTMAHWWTVREFLPAMLKRNHGHVVTIASAGSFMGVGEIVEYTGSKASALAFHEGLTQEIRQWYKAPKVRTSVIHPLWVKTPMIKSMTESTVKIRQPILELEEVSSGIVKHVLSGNSGQVIIPNRIANAALIRALPNWIQEYIRNIISGDIRKLRVAQDAKDKAEAAKA